MSRTIEIKWFSSCSTLEEVNDLYKKLARKHHPDAGGKNRDMQDINAEVDEIREHPWRLEHRKNASEPKRENHRQSSWSDGKTKWRTYEDFGFEDDLKPGTYTVRITDIHENEKKKYVALVFDIYDGPMKDHYRYFHESWFKHCIYLSYKDASSLAKTRGICQKFEKSNPGFDAGFAFCNDKCWMFTGKTIGVKLGYSDWNKGDFLTVQEVHAV